MSLQDKKQIRKLLKKLKNKKQRKYEKRKEINSSSNREDSLNQYENQDKISFIMMKLLENGNKNKELKNEL